MLNYLVYDGERSQRLVACVDSLGEAKKLTVVDDHLLDLETDRGHWTLDRRAFEPAFDYYGFVGVRLPLMNADLALYLDLRITAALAKAGLLFSNPDPHYEFIKGKDVPLFSEAESWDIIRNEIVFDGWAMDQISELTTWVDLDGNPILCDVYSGSTGALPHLPSGHLPLGELDARLWLMCMLTKPESGAETLNGNPYAYLVRRMSNFLSARYWHNEGLARFI